MSRLERWSNGNIKSLMSETKEIQRRMKKTLTRKEESREKAFVRLMMLGKIGPAAKYINNEDAVKGVHPLNEEIKNILLSKHPEARPIHQDTIYDSENVPAVEPVIFEEISAEKVQKIARNMKGSGGPTLVDSDTWKDFICSKAFNSASQLQLCQAIADLAKRLCTEELSDRVHSLSFDTTGQGTNEKQHTWGETNWSRRGSETLGWQTLDRCYKGRYRVGGWSPTNLHWTSSWN